MRSAALGLLWGLFSGLSESLCVQQVNRNWPKLWSTHSSSQAAFLSGPRGQTINVLKSRLFLAHSSGDEWSENMEEEISISPRPFSRFLQLKDIMWTREAIEDVTAAEFACSVAGAIKDKESNKNPTLDFDKLLGKLNHRLEDMVPEPIHNADGDVLELVMDKGMGRWACTNDERNELFRTLRRVKGDLQEVVKRELNRQGSSDSARLDSFSDGTFHEVGHHTMDTNSKTSAPKLYVRDDGTVDWDGALQDSTALREFGATFWARINGHTPDKNDPASTGQTHGTENSTVEIEAVTARIEETFAIETAREELERLEKLYRERETAHKQLLHSAIGVGQAVANVNLALLHPTLRHQIRLSTEALHAIEQRISYQSCVHELERIYTYLAGELGNPANGYVPLQDRLNVAEYGLLERQVETCSQELQAMSVLDADVLSVLAEQMSDFKRRLGIDYYVTGLTWDSEALASWLNDIAQRAKNGLQFYAKGSRLFWNDLMYCSNLVARAAGGYTLEPREVSTIRRTFRDVVTFFPVVILLLLPLSPVGHVFVFGGIQRFFPGFFPSCFSEQRQNLLNLYETTEFAEVKIEENLQERLVRFVEAGAFLVASQSREVFQRWSSSAQESKDKPRWDE